MGILAYTLLCGRSKAGPRVHSNHGLCSLVVELNRFQQHTLYRDLFIQVIVFGGGEQSAVGKPVLELRSTLVLERSGVYFPKDP